MQKVSSEDVKQSSLCQTRIVQWKRLPGTQRTAIRMCGCSLLSEVPTGCLTATPESHSYLKRRCQTTGSRNNLERTARVIIAESGRFRNTLVSGKVVLHRSKFGVRNMHKCERRDVQKIEAVVCMCVRTGPHKIKGPGSTDLYP